MATIRVRGCELTVLTASMRSVVGVTLDVDDDRRGRAMRNRFFGTVRRHHGGAESAQPQQQRNRFPDMRVAAKNHDAPAHLPRRFVDDRCTAQDGIGAQPEQTRLAIVFQRGLPDGLVRERVGEQRPDARLGHPSRRSASSNCAFAFPLRLSIPSSMSRFACQLRSRVKIDIRSSSDTGFSGGHRSRPVAPASRRRPVRSR